MQFRKDLRQHLYITKKVAHRKQMEKRKRKRINNAIPQVNIPLPNEMHHEEAVQDDRCRLCEKKLRGAIRCAGCEGQVCKQCSQLEEKKWRKKDNEKYWICKICDSLLLLTDQNEH